VARVACGMDGRRLLIDALRCTQKKAVLCGVVVAWRGLSLAHPLSWPSSLSLVHLLSLRLLSSLSFLRFAFSRYPSFASPSLAILPSLRYPSFAFCALPSPSLANPSFASPLLAILPSPSPLVSVAFSSLRSPPSPPCKGRCPFRSAAAPLMCRCRSCRCLVQAAQALVYLASSKEGPCVHIALPWSRLLPPVSSSLLPPVSSSLLPPVSSSRLVLHADTPDTISTRSRDMHSSSPARACYPHGQPHSGAAGEQGDAGRCGDIPRGMLPLWTGAAFPGDAHRFKAV